MKNKSEIILGIDPGTIVMGYGLLEIRNKQPSLLEMGVLKLSKYKEANQKLETIYNKVIALGEAFKPNHMAIEAPFFGKNVQSMLKLGRAQGVAIAAGMHFGLSAVEYSPKKVKQSVTGNGNADKEQIWKMLQHTLKFVEKPEFLDASDALAVALCHFYQLKSPVSGLKGKQGWDSFLKNNAHRIKS